MSHESVIALRVTDLNTLTLAVEECGGTLHRGVTTYKAYSNSKCDHVIRVPGIKYEIGVRQEKDKTYSLSGDFHAGDGYQLAAKFGKEFSKLKQAYAVHVAVGAAKRKGWMPKVLRTASDVSQWNAATGNQLQYKAGFIHVGVQA